VIRVGLGTAAIVVSFAVGALMVDGAQAFQTLVLIGVALLLDEVTSLIGAMFKAYEEMAFYALALLTNRIITTLLALAAVALGGDIVVVSAMYLIGSLSALVFAAASLRRRFPPVRLRDANRSTLVDLLKRGAPLGIAAALNMALFRVDAALLQVIDGAAAVGMYGIAYRFLDSFLFVAYALGVAAMPRIARSRWSAEAASGFNGALASMLTFYVPIAVGAFFLAPWAITVLFSERYVPAADAVRWLAAAGIFYAVAYLCRLSLVALGHRREIVTVAACALTFNVAANLLVIPRHGFVGAAAVTFLSEVLEAVALAVIFVRSVGRFRPRPLTAAPLLGGVTMVVALAASNLDDVRGAAVGAGAFVVATALAAAILAPGSARQLISRR
jgi:O-antigen/teichoic acid export membrane protein